MITCLSYADWLLQFGDGKLPHVQPAGEIELPSDLCVSTAEELVDFVFADLSLHYTDESWISSRAILCPRNEVVDMMNDRVLDLFPGDVVTCLSVDSVAEVDHQALYPVEYLNSV